MYISNNKPKTKIIKWLNEYYHNKTNKTSKYIILYGDHGNGKTTLVEELAKQFNVDLLKITAEDINTKDELNKTLKSINLNRLGNTKSQKLILVDDIQEFKKSSAITEIIELSFFPIIFTINEYPNTQTFDSVPKIEITKPLTSKTIEILRQYPQSKNYTQQELELIAKESPSVRSAINSLHTGMINKSLKTKYNVFDIKNQLKNKALQQDIDYPLCRFLTKNLNYFTKDGFKLLSKFCLYDYKEKRKIKYFRKSPTDYTLSKYYFNLLPTDLTTITWIKHQKEKKKKTKSAPKKKEPKQKNQIIQEPSQTDDISKYF